MTVDYGNLVEPIRDHLTRGDLRNGLVYDAVHVSPIETGARPSPERIS